MGNGSRLQKLAIGGGLLVIAVLLGLGLRALIDDDADSDDASAVTVPTEDPDGETPNAESPDDSDDNTTTTEAGDEDDTDTTTTSSSTSSSDQSTTTEGATEPSFVELSDLVLTRTGECQSLTVAVDAIIQVASDGQTATFNFPENGGLVEGTVGERSSLTVGDQISAQVGDDWNISVFSREHLVEGAYSDNHTTPGPVSGTYPGRARMKVGYEIAESNGDLTISPLVLNAGSDCQTVAPTVFATFNSSAGTESSNNGTASQKPAPLGQSLTLLDGQRFDLTEGWTLTVFVREDWSGRSYSMTHDGPSVVSEVFAANDQGDPELTLSYTISIG